VKRTLIDVTDLETWNGTHGGIQRVVYALTKAYYEESKSANSNIDFIAFDRDEKTFYYADFKRIYNRVEKLDLEIILHVEQEASGISRPIFAKSLMRLVDEIAIVKASVLPLRKMKHHFRKNPDRGAELKTKKWVEFSRDDEVLVLGMAWENLDIQMTLTKERHDKHFKLIQLVYDMIICLYPHLHHPDNYKPYMTHMLGVVAESDLLLAISDSTKRDIAIFAKEHQITPPKIEVIRLGDELGSTTDEPAKPQFAIAEKFILCVGTVEVRKNHSLLYYVYKLSQERHIKLPQLIIVGGSGWFSGDIQYLIKNDPAIQGHITIAHGLDDAQLAWLYKNCQFTVYPSMYEGWGLPIAESLAYGKLCLASHTSSMTEIAGDMIDYFSPYNSEECLDKITSYMDKATLSAAQRNIAKHYIPTSWTTTFGQVATYIKELSRNDK
jgi:glycosyltransferase involved in cell wall biosynthesis